MKLFKSVFITIIYAAVACANSAGKPIESKSAAKEDAASILIIKKAVSRYQIAKAVKIDLNKTVTLALLGETTVSEGQLFMSKGRLRLEIKQPEPSLIVMNKAAIWLETPTPKELGGRAQVIKIKVSGQHRRSKAPLAALMNDAKTWDQLKVVKQSREKEIMTVELRPLSPKFLGEIVKVSLVINTEKNELSALAYFDELDNETNFQFKKADFTAKVAEKKFNYAPPAGAEVTEY